MSDQKPTKPRSTRSERIRVTSRQRRDVEKQATRQMILQTSSELLVQHGYANFSLRQVAEQIGYSPGTIYLYFEDKADILLAIMNEGITLLHGMLAQAAVEQDVRVRLATMSRAYVDFGLKYPAYFQLMFMQRPQDLVRPDNATSPLLGASFALWYKMVEDAMRADILRMGDPVNTGDVLWALLHGVVSIAILMPLFDDKRIREMIDTALEMITNGLHR